MQTTQPNAMQVFYPLATSLGGGLGVGAFLFQIQGGLIPYGLALARSVVLWAAFVGLMRLGFYWAERWRRVSVTIWPVREQLVLGACLATLFCLCMLASLAFSRWSMGLPPMAASRAAMVLFAGTLATGVLFIGLNAVQRLLEAQRELSSSEARAQVLAFQARFQPHAIFNALNAIAALIPEDPERAETATEELARLLRGILDAFAQEHWPLSQELRLVEDLLKLEGLRFGDRLSWKVNLPAELGAWPVPPLLLLPLVENALKHGCRAQVGGGVVEVRIHPGRLEVFDNGPGRNPAASDGVGLSLTRERLMRVGGRLSFERGNEGPDALGCLAVVELPVFQPVTSRTSSGAPDSTRHR